jgi:hypothetical protein
MREKIRNSYSKETAMLGNAYYVLIKESCSMIEID